ASNICGLSGFVVAQATANTYCADSGCDATPYCQSTGDSGPCCCTSDCSDLNGGAPGTCNSSGQCQTTTNGVPNVPCMAYPWTGVPEMSEGVAAAFFVLALAYGSWMRRRFAMAT